MKAVQWSWFSGGLEKNLEVVLDAKLPLTARSLPKDYALVKVAYTTLNPFDFKMPEIPIIRSLAFQKPAIPCEDFSGTVVSSTLPHVKPGERVFGISPPPKFGALCEYLIITGKDGIVSLPGDLSLHDTATIGVCGGTAYQTIVPFVQLGSKVFINGGSGSVGKFAIQIAKAVGCTVTTTCYGSNIELCKTLGADQLINYRTTDVVEHLRRQETQYDLLVDYVGTPTIYWNTHHYLKKTCYFVTVAANVTFSDIRALLAMFLLPRWLGRGQRKANFVVLTPKAEDCAQIAQWMQEGKIKTAIEKTYELEQAADAFAKLKAGRARGKLVVSVAGG